MTEMSARLNNAARSKKWLVWKDISFHPSHLNWIGIGVELQEFIRHSLS